MKLKKQFVEKLLIFFAAFDQEIAFCRFSKTLFCFMDKISWFCPYKPSKKQFEQLMKPTRYHSINYVLFAMIFVHFIIENSTSGSGNNRKRRKEASACREWTLKYTTQMLYVLHALIIIASRCPPQWLVCNAYCLHIIYL
jgi:hypothetical protein